MFADVVFAVTDKFEIDAAVRYDEDKRENTTKTPQGFLPQPAGERTFTLAELRAAPFRRADQQIEVLSRLPEMISGSASDQELCVRLVNLLLSGIAHATAAAVVEVTAESEPTAGKSTASGPIAVLHWDRRVLTGSDFRPSERLIRQSLAGGASTAFTWIRVCAPIA